MESRRHARLLLAAAALTAPVAARAQPAAPGAPVATERGCRGDEIRVSAAMKGPVGWPTAYPVVTRVQPGSPAERAGLQVGDTIVTQGGVDLLAGRPPAQRFAVGDTIRMTVRRDGRTRAVALVLGRLSPPGAGAGRARGCRPVRDVVAARG
jgi:S1-C subfamily serine protease